MLEENEMLKNSLRLAIIKIQEFDNDYKKPSRILDELQLTKQQYKEIMK